MKIQSHTNKGFVVTGSGTGGDSLAFYFLCELLTSSIARHGEEIIIESRKFLFDSKIGIKTTDSLRTVIDREKLVETSAKTEMSISGTIENKKGERDTFTLFLVFMPPIGTVALFPTYSREAVPEKNYLIIPFGKTSEQLPNSVFELDLYRRDLTGQKCPMGNSRGYLVFGR